MRSRPSNDVAPRGIAMPAALRSQLAGIGQIYFQCSPVFGLVFLLCLYLTRPVLALGCLLGVGAATATAVLARFPAEQRNAGLYGYNAALSGIGLCAGYQFNAALLAWIVGAGVASCMLMWLFQRAGLPMLTIWFVLVMWLANGVGAVLGLRELPAVPGAGACVMTPLSYVLCAFGLIAFIGSAPLGMLMLAALASREWRQCMWILCGAVSAWCVVFAGEGVWPQTGFSANTVGIGVNGILVMLAASGYQQPWPLRLAAFIFSTTLCLLFDSLALPYLTLPYIFGLWICLRWPALRGSDCRSPP
jgi:urea transporter